MNENPIVGTCNSMCPLKEIKWREENKLLHMFEVKSNTHKSLKADPNKVVKQFSRSAAGKEQATPSDLRPSPVLLKTMNYLVTEIIPISYAAWNKVYDFVNDRIQAIRQDMMIQMIIDSNAVKIYEKSVRFYILSSYILCEEPQTVFDPHLNNQQLFICLEKLFDLYKQIRSECTSEFIAIHYSLNLKHIETFYRSVTYFSEFMCEDIVKLSIKTCLASMEGNCIRFYNLVKRLPLILLLCFFHQFGDIRKRTLQALSISFSSNNCKFPIEVLCDWLCLSTEKDVIQLLEFFNIKVACKSACFHKKDFNINTCRLYPKKELLINSKLKNISWSELVDN